MKEEIKNIEKQIGYMKGLYENIETEQKNAYKILGYNYKRIVPYLDNDELKYKIKDYEYVKEIIIKLEEKGIDINKKYFITDNIYLSIFGCDNSFTFGFYVEDASWLYDNYISSYSGINEWIFNLIKEEYDLFSGNSSYNYAFGTCTLNDYLRIIENKKEKYYTDRKYSVEQVAKNIENLISYFTDENNKIRNIIIEEINRKLNNMKKLIGEEK
jgi:hypothetical protein